MTFFCSSTTQAGRVLEVMAANGLNPGEDGLEVYVMRKITSNVVLAKAFAEPFDGFPIGSNDLKQLTLGVDRDTEELLDLFDEQVKGRVAAGEAAQTGHGQDGAARGR